MSKLGRIYKDNKGDRYYIQLPGKVRIFCDKSHRSFYSRQHAEWALAAITGELENGSFDAQFYAKTKKSINGFSEYAMTWLQRQEKRTERGELSPTYLRELRRWVIKRYIPYFQHTPVQDIKGLQIRGFADTLDGITQKTRQNCLDALNKLFRDCVDDEMIQVCPRFPKRDVGPEPSWNWLSEDVQDVVLSHLDGDAAFFISFMMCHGVRTGECRALEHQDIDLEHDCVTIRRSFAGAVLRETTKSKRIRTIPLDMGWKELYLARPTPINRQMFVFTKQGKPYSESWMRKQWNAACEAARVPHISLYSGSRHSLASQCASRGESIYLISKMLGHTNTKITERYSHLKTESLRAVQRKGSVISLLAKIGNL